MSVTYSGDYTQWGNSATATQNFVLKVPAAPDGTIALYRGNYGAESATIFSVSAAGALAFRGTTTNDSAAAGYVGEYVEAIVSAGNTGGTGVYFDPANISLTAGDWDVSGLLFYNANGATWSQVRVGISATSGDFGTGLVDGSNLFYDVWASSSTTPLYRPVSIPVFRVSIASTTTYYLKGLASYTAGQVKLQGGRISARRVR